MSVVVVSGLPRSGTSLVMQMLEAGGLPALVDDERPPDEDNPRGYYEYAPVKASLHDTSWVDRGEGRAVKVIHRLLHALPRGHRYRVILLRRDPGEVMASQREMLRRRGGSLDEVDEVGEARLSQVMVAQLDEAERWVEGREDADLLVLEHAHLIGDPQGAAAALSGFLGGGLDTGAMAACVDPALHRQRAAR